MSPPTCTLRCHSKEALASQSYHHEQHRGGDDGRSIQPRLEAALCRAMTPPSSGSHMWRGGAPLSHRQCGDQGARPERCARCGPVGEQRLFGRSMDEKALSMMVLFQDISRYMEGSRSVKVLVLSCSMASRTERRRPHAHRGNTNSEAEYANNKNCTPNISSADRCSQIVLAIRSQTLARSRYTQCVF
jgi:hypothetical protein